MKSLKLHEIDSRAICDRSPQVYLQCQLQLIAERKELLPLSRAKAGVVSTHPCENNTESLYIKTYFLTLIFFFFLLLNQNVGFWWAFSAVAAIEGIKKSGKYVGNKKILLPTNLLTE